MMRNKLLLDLKLSHLCIGLTGVATVLFGRDAGAILLERIRAGSALEVAEQLAFIAIIAVMLYGNWVYQVARLGCLQRMRRHRAAPPQVLERIHDTEAPPLSILIPSYKEEIGVIRRTMLCAALQEHPNRHVVLLIDDPPAGSRPEDRLALQRARELPVRLEALLEKPAKRFASALGEFMARRDAGPLDAKEEALRLAELHAEASTWFTAQASNEPTSDHTQRLFVETVFDAPARRLLATTLELEKAAATGSLPSPGELLRGHLRLAGLFRATLTSFERKRYVNLSHRANKAMNLNSYIGLIGGSYAEVQRADGLHLEPAVPDEADLLVPDAEFLITLDADTLLTGDYALRLIEVMGRPENRRVAVIQTPYSAFPGATGPVERVAGATTDIQYVIHQGFTRHGATYWVGANALLRRAALEDLREEGSERGYRVPRFIHDRTVIEDTESSVDLVARGWTLHNYPARLAYSATPADFGALLIQRRRWADGGLLILPKLLRCLWRGRWGPGRLAEAFLRCHYLTSIAGVNIGLLLLLAYPFEQSLREPWLPIAAAPYFLLYGRDLVRSGYRFSDVVRAYALNLVLLPVNLGGVLSSLRQAWTGRQTPFARTPKITDRTPIPRAYVLALYGLLILVAGTLLLNLVRERWLHAILLLVNGGLMAYGMVRFVGIRESLGDLGLHHLGQPVGVSPRTPARESP